MFKNFMEVKFVKNMYERNELYKVKIDLLCYGITISKSCYDSLEKGINGNVNHNDYITTKGLFLVLDEQAYVNANLNKNSRYELDFVDNKYVLFKEKVKICKVDVIQSPSYALQNKKLDNGILISDLVNLHGDRLRIQPIMGCANRCKFCDLNCYKYHLNSIENLDSAVKLVQKESKFRHILISGGAPFDTQKDYDYLNSVYKYFGENYGEEYPIDIMMVPRGLYVNDDSDASYEEFLLKLKEWNISSMAINLELYNDKLREKLIPQKNFIGKERYINFIKLAVKIFGKGTVRSCIIIGLERLEDSLKAVELLSSVGCMPVLSPYVPMDEKDKVPTSEFMEEVLIKASEIVKKYNVELGPKCDFCKHNTIHFK